MLLSPLPISLNNGSSAFFTLTPVTLLSIFTVKQTAVHGSISKVCFSSGLMKDSHYCCSVTSLFLFFFLNWKLLGPNIVILFISTSALRHVSTAGLFLVVNVGEKVTFT